MAKASSSKLLFELRSPLPAKVYRARFEPYASTEFVSVRALKKVDKAVIECGTLDIAGRCVTLVAEVKHGVITEIRPAACKSCAPRKGRKPAPKAQVQKLIGVVDQELAKRKIEPPVWPVGQALRSSLGFRIPLGPIIVIIGTDPDEGVDTFDICIVINIGTKSCIYCLFRPTACLDLPGPL